MVISASYLQRFWVGPIICVLNNDVPSEKKNTRNDLWNNPIRRVSPVEIQVVGQSAVRRYARPAACLLEDDTS